MSVAAVLPTKWLWLQLWMLQWIRLLLWWLYSSSNSFNCDSCISYGCSCAVMKCTRAYGSGSQCRPNECIFGSGKPRGVGILGRRVYEPGEGNGEVSLWATWERGGRILSQQGGFQVSRGGQKGEQRGAKGKQQGEKEEEESALYIQWVPKV